jgi:hypothetical protein
MTKALRDRYFGNTIDEWISTLPGKLAVDAVGLRQIVSFGREGFGLSGDQLTDFVRRGIEELFVKGAKPVIGAMDGIRGKEDLSWAVESWNSGEGPPLGYATAPTLPRPSNSRLISAAGFAGLNR